MYRVKNSLFLWKSCGFLKKNCDNWLRLLISGEDEELEPGEQRSSATILAARAAKEGLAKARAALNNTAKAVNTSIEQLEPGQVQHKVTVVVEDDELEPGEVRR